MELAHDSKMSGHLGIKKTQDRVCGSVYWSGIYSDVKRYCKSCDVCQRTVHKGRVSPVPLGKMPLIDVPFKRAAIDLIGPINPTTNEGHAWLHINHRRLCNPVSGGSGIERLYCQRGCRSFNDCFQSGTLREISGTY